MGFKKGDKPWNTGGHLTLAHKKKLRDIKLKYYARLKEIEAYDAELNKKEAKAERITKKDFDHLTLVIFISSLIMSGAILSSISLMITLLFILVAFGAVIFGLHE